MERGAAKAKPAKKRQRNDDELKSDEDALPGPRKGGRSQCACIACATRIDQSFANYARDFFLP